MENQEIEYLKKLGFEQEYPNDPDYRHITFRLNIKNHPLLTGLYLVIAEDWIEVGCLDCLSSKYSDEVCIAKRKYSKKNLEVLLEYLS